MSQERTPSRALIQAIMVTAELTETALSKAAATVMANDLARYPERQVIGALERVRRECSRLRVADVIARLDDGRPGPEQAWSMIPKDEDGSVVWTDEMATAFGAANPLLQSGDTIAARMAFREVYAAAVAKARDEATPVRWTPSLGRSIHERQAALEDAVRHGRLSAEQAQPLLAGAATPRAESQKLLADLVVAAPASVREELRRMLPGLGRVPQPSETRA